MQKPVTIAKDGSIKLYSQKFLDSIRLKEMKLLVEGNHDCAYIDSQITSGSAELRYNYNKRLRLRPGLKGWVGIKFVITSSGKVVECNIVESTVKDDEFEDTLISIINRWHFRQMDTETDSTYIYFPFCCGGFCGSYSTINCNGEIRYISR